MSLVTDALRDARKAAGLRQREVAEALHISQAFVSDIEHGRRELGEQHYDKLPEPIRVAVLKAALSEAQERARRMRALMRK